jgi:hypothetical protein
VASIDWCSAQQTNTKNTLPPDKHIPQPHRSIGSTTHPHLSTMQVYSSHQGVARCAEGVVLVSLARPSHRTSPETAQLRALTPIQSPKHNRAAFTSSRATVSDKGCGCTVGCTLVWEPHFDQ